MRISVLVTTFIALALGNYLYQAFSVSPNYLVMAERDFFQFIAILAVFIQDKIMTTK